ncbi:hypothetical protein Q1695_000687 [Nippostrongylus brasiliensis]|nr:hypothetical protein Q1695_000687 [Nippostrongylus brasiliensis]
MSSGCHDNIALHIRISQDTRNGIARCPPTGPPVWSQRTPGYLDGAPSAVAAEADTEGCLLEATTDWYGSND